MTQLFGKVRSWPVLGTAAVAVCALLLSPPTAPAQDRAQKTSEYWKAIKNILQEEAVGDEAALEKKITAVRNVARRVDGLSARGVDTEAVEVTDQMVKLFKRVGNYLDDYGDADRGFKSGLRDGLNNNPTRAIDEREAIKRDMEATKEAASKARKRLEAKYDVDLPSLFE
jgi:hypothetical protein